MSDNLKPGSGAHKVELYRQGAEFKDFKKNFVPGIRNSKERAQAFGEATAQSLRESGGELRRSGAVTSVGDNLKPGVTREMVEAAAEALDSEFESRPKTDTRFFAEFMREQAARARAELLVMTLALDVMVQEFIDFADQIKKEQ